MLWGPKINKYSHNQTCTASVEIFQVGSVSQGFLKREIWDVGPVEQCVCCWRILHLSVPSHPLVGPPPSAGLILTN